jgi:hypothetical protein
MCHLINACKFGAFSAYSISSGLAAIESKGLGRTEIKMLVKSLDDTIRGWSEK